MLAAVIAVLGTLLGAVVAGAFQQKNASRTQRAAADEQLRRERLEAVTALAAAGSDHRRAMWMRGEAELAGTSPERLEELRIASHATRSAITRPPRRRPGPHPRPDCPHHSRTGPGGPVRRTAAGCPEEGQMKNGSVDSLNVWDRCGASANARQIREIAESGADAQARRRLGRRRRQGERGPRPLHHQPQTTSAPTTAHRPACPPAPNAGRIEARPPTRSLTRPTN